MCRAAPITHRTADQTKAEDQHSPCGGFGNCGQIAAQFTAGKLAGVEVEIGIARLQSGEKCRLGLGECTAVTRHEGRVIAASIGQIERHVVSCRS